MKAMIGHRHSTVGAAFLSTLVVASLLLLFPVKSHAQSCVPTVWDLTAGQTIPVGSVTVSNDANNIYVTYAIDNAIQPSATFGTLHLWIGNDLTQVHNGGNSRPAPGQLPFISGATKGGYSFPSSAGSTSYTFTIPFSAINVTDVSSSTTCPNLPALYVVTHAEVKSVLSGSTIKDQTAFGGPTPGAGSSWWFYGQYTICCDFGGAGVCFSETAFAKGNNVWTTDKKSNPENMSSLKLTKNRWGWAINLSGASNISTYTIYAGAGLNDISKGVNVGTLTVNVSEGTVKYEMNGNYHLEEVHVYSSATPPASMAQLAPGSFGYPAGGYDVDPDTESVSKTVNVPSMASGSWLIGHAVVSNGFCD